MRLLSATTRPYNLFEYRPASEAALLPTRNAALRFSASVGVIKISKVR
jgi:hypothetical protein